MKKKHQRSGTAVVELAVCLPVVFMIVLLSIEACNMIVLKQVITESAYEGALAALRADATESDVITGINSVLSARSVTPNEVSVEGTGGSPFASIDRGQPFTVTVEVLADENVFGPRFISLGKVLVGQATAIKQ